jgi:hypothetical protein
MHLTFWLLGAADVWQAKICDLCQKNSDYVPKINNLFYCIEHFTSFNLVPGSPILDNSFQNYVILEKQLSMPIVLRK